MSKEPEWFEWTLDKMEENLALVEEHAKEYLRKPYSCDCFLKHSAALKGYSGEMMNFCDNRNVNGQCKTVFQNLYGVFEDWHRYFEHNKQPPKEKMMQVVEVARDIRKRIAKIEEKVPNPNPRIKITHKRCRGVGCVRVKSNTT